jgi:chromosome segregation ATPase
MNELTTTKSHAFWTKPESVPAWAALGVGGFFLLTAWGSVVGFLATMMENTFKMTAFGVATVALLYVVFSPKTHMLFRLLSRTLMNMIIPVFPIEILKDRLNQIKKRRESMNEQISLVNGQIKTLQNQIAKNEKTRKDSFEAANYAQKQAQTAQDEEERLRMAAAVQVKAKKAGRLEKANLSYADLLAKLQGIYKMLSRYSIHIDSFIEDTEDEVRQEEIRFKTINAAYKAYKTALSVIKGNVDEEDVYNTTMEFLADQAGQKLGEIDDFTRISQNFMDNMDIQNGVVTENALKQLEQYNTKLLTAGEQPSLLQANTPAKQMVPSKATIDIDKLFN